MPARQSGVSGRCAHGRRALARMLWAVAGSAACAAAAAPPVAPPVAPLAAPAIAPVPGTEVGTPSAAPAPPALAPQEVSVEAPEPKYVAPTLRDRIGRIWAPVLIDGKGPFRLVLDTGASDCAVTAAVAQALGIMPDRSPVRLQGVTGAAIVPAIRADSLIVGDMQLKSTLLPIVPDALGGAQGVLGTKGLLDKRIFIDFRHDRITIRRSHDRRAPNGFVTVPVELTRQHLLTTTAYVGSIRVTAIIDTGAQVSVANLALRRALQRRRSHYHFTADKIIGTTDAVADGQGTAVPPIRIGGISIRGAYITTGDLQIFGAWKMTATPAVLIGMDALGTVDTLIIDYRLRELQIRTRDGD
ncbi:MAG: retropepsin-like aspartic protease [Steroidobacteraceae bacterium]